EGDLLAVQRSEHLLAVNFDDDRVPLPRLYHPLFRLQDDRLVGAVLVRVVLPDREALGVDEDAAEVGLRGVDAQGRLAGAVELERVLDDGVAEGQWVADDRAVVVGLQFGAGESAALDLPLPLALPPLLAERFVEVVAQEQLASLGHDRPGRLVCRKYRWEAKDTQGQEHASADGHG